MRIAVISDLHFSRVPSPLSERIGRFADIFLLRAVHRLNRYLRPDFVFIGGDLLNDPSAPDALELLGELRSVLALLKMPFIVIPGNHDPAPEAFYQVMPRPPEHLDIGGCRFIAFPDDAQTAGDNARRAPAEVERMKRLAAAHHGPVVSLQHVPLFPAGRSDCLYNYENSAEIIAPGLTLTIGGHYHAGMRMLNHDRVSAIAAPALCEAPFRFLILDLDCCGSVVGAETHALAMPEELRLTDGHVHTRFAYCNQNMDAVKALELASLFGLDQIAFSEHSAHLYLSQEDYRKKEYYRNGLAGCALRPRLAEYFAELARHAGRRFLRGLELDFDAHGRPLAMPEDLCRIDLRIGAVHYLENHDDPAASREEFMAQTRGILSSGVAIYAHPFRAIRRHIQPAPPGLYASVVRLLRDTGTAAEINFHANTPDPEFVLMCVKEGVKLAFGSDSHNLYQVGEFYPHLELMKSIGCYGRLPEILFRPEPL